MFIKSVLKSLVILVIWLGLSCAIYSQITLFFALHVNCIFFSATENESVSGLVFRLLNFAISKWMYNKVAMLLNFGLCNFGLKSYSNLWFQILNHAVISDQIPLHSVQLHFEKKKIKLKETWIEKKSRWSLLSFYIFLYSSTVNTRV